MAVYIQGLGNISPQKTFDTRAFMSEFLDKEGNSLGHEKPDFTPYFSAREARRMSKILKMGVSAAKICLEDAGIEMPDAIITATGMGCREDTQKFMQSIDEYDLEFVSPTAFIQSTHNTVGARIALVLGCNNYNFTYVNRGFSFESALIDGIIKIEDENADTVLVGSADEYTESSIKIAEGLGLLRDDHVKVSELYTNPGNGIVAGEGAAFMVLGKDATKASYAKIVQVKTLFNPKSTNAIGESMNQFLQNNNLAPSDIDLLITGMNGDQSEDQVYKELIQKNFAENAVANFKHFSGEYHTSSTFALWMAALIIKEQKLPNGTLFSLAKAPEKIETILIHNHFGSKYHSFILLSRV